jgi:hypothetical protein
MMARILVHTNDRRTVLEEGNVQLQDINDQRTAVGLLDRLERAVHDADRRRVRPDRRVRRLAAILPACDYRDARH